MPRRGRTERPKLPAAAVQTLSSTASPPRQYDQYWDTNINQWVGCMRSETDTGSYDIYYPTKVEFTTSERLVITKLQISWERNFPGQN